MTGIHETDRLNAVERPPGLIETEAFWININEHGAPTRISDNGFQMLSSTTDQHRLRWKPFHPLNVPSVFEPGSPADRVHVLRSTDFDPFKHLNNASYWVVIEHELVDHPDIAIYPHRAVIEYLRPIAPDAEVTVRRRRVGNRLFVWMLVDGVVVTIASVTTL